MQLTYRGQAYQSSSVVLPTIIAEQDMSVTYRGVTTTAKRYEFKAATLDHPNWRTMRFMGKRYTAAPSLSLV
ncbi:MAG: DUF4278 domain-containing protein [Thainema sp.]